ncbi:MAG TPA: GNAT family N-acetyltransferase [Bryobacteraceae bacterium]|nr:GNAT family N-acetyltransferase [Bryobacteraceae bacterium]
MREKVGASRLVLRPATPADTDAVTALLKVSYSQLLAASYHPGTLELVLPYIGKANPVLLASGKYYAAEAEPGALVGCGGWTPEKPGSGEIAEGEAHLRHFAVHPDWIQRGIGTALLNRCIAGARSAGVRLLHCFSTLNGEPFYQASGFRRIGSIDLPVGPGIVLPSVLMQREIS